MSYKGKVVMVLGIISGVGKSWLFMVLCCWYVW